MADDHLDWEDIRAFAVALESSSYRQAAERLGTTHPTVRRRLASLEASTGLRLFQRDVPGLHATSEGRQLVDAAREVERSVQAFARQARAADARARGAVKVTIAMSTAMLLAPAIAAFCASWPEIQVIVDTDEAFADLASLEADIAVRAYAGGRRPDPSLAGRHAVSAMQAVYGDPGARCWIATADTPEWVTTTPFPDLPVRAVISEAHLRFEACRLGMGLAVLPCVLGDPCLSRRSEPEHGYDVWVLVHPDARHNARFKLFRDAMVAALRALEPASLG